LSRKGKLIIASHDGHHIQLDEPEVVNSGDSRCAGSAPLTTLISRNGCGLDDIRTCLSGGTALAASTHEYSPGEVEAAVPIADFEDRDSA